MRQGLRYTNGWSKYRRRFLLAFVTSPIQYGLHDIVVWVSPCLDRNYQVFDPPATSFSSRGISIFRCAPRSASTGGRSNCLLLNRNPLACTALPPKAVQSGLRKTVDRDVYSLTIQLLDLRSVGCIMHPQQCLKPLLYAGTNALSKWDVTRYDTSSQERVYPFKNLGSMLKIRGRIVSRLGSHLCRKRAQRGPENRRPAKLL